MTHTRLHISAASLIGTLLFATSTFAQTHPAAAGSPYGGSVVEDLVARVNDQIITRSDYDRSLKELDQEAREHGATMQEIAEGHKDLLRGLIDQQLWLSKGKELGITGDTELIKRLDEYRKQYHLDTMEDLEKAAKDQGVSWEDFKANIRNGIITQLVMRQQVGEKLVFTPGEVARYYDQHKQEYIQQESVHLSEILVSAGTPAAGSEPDQAALTTAKAKADDLEAKLHAGGDFSQLARTFSDGPTAAQGGDLGQFRPGALAKVLEEKTFPLKAGEYTEPIQTRQGYVILKVLEHVQAGVPPLKDVQEQVEEAYYMSRMEPAIRAYLTTMREESYIEVAPGFADTGASPKQIKPSYSAYAPPAPKKKKKVQRTRYRETTHNFRQKNTQAEAPAEEAAAPAPKGKKGKAQPVNLATMKPGKKEKIRYGQAPSETLPDASKTKVEDAGAVQTAANTTPEPVNPLEAARPTQKTRFSERAKLPKPAKKTANGLRTDPQAPLPPDAGEIADRQTQSAPLGLGSNTAAGKKKKATTVGQKTRFTQKSKTPGNAKPEVTPAPSVPGAPAPATAPQTQ